MIDLTPEKLVTMIMDDLCDTFAGLRVERDHNNAYAYFMSESAEERIFGNAYTQNFSGPAILVFIRQPLPGINKDVLEHVFADDGNIDAIYKHICTVQVCDHNGIERIILRKDTGTHWHFFIDQPDSFERLYDKVESFGVKRKKTSELGSGTSGVPKAGTSTNAGEARDS